MEAVGAASSFEAAIDIARPGGTVGHVGVPVHAGEPRAGAHAEHPPARRRRPGARLHRGADGGHPRRAPSTPRRCSTPSSALEEVPEGYAAMDERRALKVLVRTGARVARRPGSGRASGGPALDLGGPGALEQPEVPTAATNIACPQARRRPRRPRAPPARERPREVEQRDLPGEPGFVAAGHRRQGPPDGRGHPPVDAVGGRALPPGRSTRRRPRRSRPPTRLGHDARDTGAAGDSTATSGACPSDRACREPMTAPHPAATPARGPIGRDRPVDSRLPVLNLDGRRVPWDAFSARPRVTPH